jgi:hypothetical protein
LGLDEHKLPTERQADNRCLQCYRTIMLIKINREDCLKGYPNFPLRRYDEVSDEEEYQYPEVFAICGLKSSEALQ